MKKKCAGIVLLFLLLAVAFLYIENAFNGTNMYASFERSLANWEDKLLEKIQIYQGAYIDHEDEAFRKFSKFFDAKITSIDLRTASESVFTFDPGWSITSFELIYCKNRRINIGADTVFSEEMDELRLEHLGINGEGYIYCKRIKPSWIYREIFLPT